MANKICIDLGASQIKCIYQLENQSSPTALTLLPNLAQTDIRMLDKYRDFNKAGIKLSSDIGWVSKGKSSKTVIAADLLAEEFYGIQDYQKPKTDEGIYRVAATIGKIFQQEKIPLPEKPSWPIELTVLLPYGEFDEKQNQKFAQKLANYLKHYYYREQLISLEVSDIGIYPEGLGGLLIDAEKSPSQSIEIIVMLGHRNSSYLIFESQKFVRGKSITLGFHTLVAKFCEKTIAQEENQATILTLWKARLDERQLQRLVKSLVKENKELEYQQIIKVFKGAKTQLWNSLKIWFKKELKDQEFDRIKFIGGTAEFLKPLILADELFGRINPLFISQKYQEMIMNSVDFSQEKKSEDIALRLIDCYGVFRGL